MMSKFSFTNFSYITLLRGTVEEEDSCITPMLTKHTLHLQENINIFFSFPAMSNSHACFAFRSTAQSSLSPPRP